MQCRRRLPRVALRRAQNATGRTRLQTPWGGPGIPSDALLGGPASRNICVTTILANEHRQATTGTLALPDRTYSINGENAFAELWSNIPGDRLTVEWQPSGDTLVIIWDWFGAAIPYSCNLTGSSFI